MIKKDEIVLLARDLLTELPESVIFSRENLIGLIPSAISLWQTRTNEDAAKRQNFIRESDPVIIKGNVADISDAVDEYRFRLEFIAGSDIYFDYAGGVNFKVKFVESFDRLQMRGRQDKFFVKAHLSGTRITFKFPNAPEGAPAISNKFKIRSVVLPDDLSEIPASVAPEIALVVAELAKGEYTQQNRSLDIPLK